MIDVIYTYFRKRKLRKILIKIMGAHPEMATELIALPEEEAVTKYIYAAMNEYMVQKLTYQQACQTQPDRASFIQSPVMPWLLVQAIQAWVSHETYVYAMLVIQQDLELTVLRRYANEAEEVRSMRVEQEKIREQLSDITDRVEKELQKNSQAIKPENRLN